jgi:hypothetical protein
MGVESRIVLCLIMALGLSACSSLQRSTESGYADGSTVTYDAPLEYQTERQQYLDQQALIDLGLPPNTPIDEQTAALIDDHIEVSRLEKQLVTAKEKKQYYALKGFMKDDKERIRFLELPGTEVREQWARANGIDRREDLLTSSAAPLIEKKDIALGMTHKAVQESWGDPEAVEISGDPLFGNERWRYTHYTSGPSGYAKQQRIVYFKSGRVVGWETL